MMKRTDSMNVRELKSYIESAGFSHADCSEKPELQERASQIEAGVTDATLVKNKPQSSSKKGTLRHRKKGNQPSGEETELVEKIRKLTADSNAVVGGRDGTIIQIELDAIKARLENVDLTVEGKHEVDLAIKDIEEGLAFEKSSGRVLQVGLLFVFLAPMLLSLLEYLTEYATRPSIVADTRVDLAATTAVVTGGCGAVGIELAIMLAEAGAGVIIGCHSRNPEARDEFSDTTQRLTQLGLLKGSQSSVQYDDEEEEEEPIADRRGSNAGWIEVFPLQLESFDGVREFASRVVDEVGTVDLLIHNAATKEGCVRTLDGHELATQVNYMSPFLLTHLLTPSLRKTSIRRGSARVVYTTCDAALTLPDFLPWPLVRTSVELLPRVNIKALKQREENEEGKIPSCAPLMDYANAKLNIILHTRELHRRLNTGFNSRGVSHVVNPGAMNNAFGLGENVPTSKPSMRANFMAYFPPVWIGKKIYGLTVTVASNGMLRDVQHGAHAVFHIATSSGLSSSDNGGGLFADTAGSFTDCAGVPSDCGRVQASSLPLEVKDDTLAAELWSETEAAIGSYHLRPLKPDAATAEAAEKAGE